jgi:hypothetical protein
VKKLVSSANGTSVLFALTPLVARPATLGISRLMMKNVCRVLRVVKYAQVLNAPNARIATF